MLSYHIATQILLFQPIDMSVRHQSLGCGRWILFKAQDFPHNQILGVKLVLEQHAGQRPQRARDILVGKLEKAACLPPTTNQRFNAQTLVYLFHDRAKIVADLANTDARAETKGFSAFNMVTQQRLNGDLGDIARHQFTEPEMSGDVQLCHAEISCQCHEILSHHRAWNPPVNCLLQYKKCGSMWRVGGSQLENVLGTCSACRLQTFSQ